MVQERRGPKLAAATSSGNGNGAAGPADLDSSVFSGRVWTGRGALRLGLVDGIGDMTSVLRKKFGQDVRITCVNPTPRGGFPFLPGMDATLAAMTGSSGGGGGRGGVAAFAAAAAARLLDPVNHGPRLMARCPASAEGDSAACYSGGAGTSILGGASATAGRCGGSGSGCDTASAGIRASGSCNAACELGVTNLAASSVASMVAASAEAASASTDSAVARSDASALALVDALHEALAYDESFATFRT